MFTAAKNRLTSPRLRIACTSPGTPLSVQGLPDEFEVVVRPTSQRKGRDREAIPAPDDLASARREVAALILQTAALRRRQAREEQCARDDRERQVAAALVLQREARRRRRARRAERALQSAEAMRRVAGRLRSPEDGSGSPAPRVVRLWDAAASGERRRARPLQLHKATPASPDGTRHPLGTLNIVNARGLTYRQLRHLS